MTRYELAIKAADELEARPHLYDFTRAAVPLQGYYIGEQRRCVLGQIGAVHGGYDGEYVSQVSALLLGMSDSTFYRRMMEEDESTEWMRSGVVAARVLRRVAENYFKNPKEITDYTGWHGAERLKDVYQGTLTSLTMPRL